MSDAYPTAAMSLSRHFPKPRITARGVLTAFVAWLFYSLLMALSIASAERIPFGWAMAGQVLSSVLLALASIPAWLIVVQKLYRAGWLWKLGAHVCIAPAYVYVNYALYLQLLSYVAGPEATSAVERVRMWILVTYGISYVVQFALYHGMEAVRQLSFRERQAAALMALAREQELAALKSQINPHFFFNTLNSISAMASSNVEETRTMIARLADLLRYAIDSSKRDLVPLREELEFVQSYIELEQKRLDSRLAVQYDIAENSLNNLIPPLSIQPLVENAIRHGIEPSENGGTISLSISSDHGEMSVRVHDTGAGVRGESGGLKKNGIGLKNTDARLRTIFGDAVGLWSRAPAGGGFEAGFTIPVQRQERQ